MDKTIFFWANGLAGRIGVADVIGRVFALGAPEIFGLCLLALWFLPPRSAVHIRRAVFYAAASGVLALVVSAGISHFYYRPRPFVMYPNLVHLLISHGKDSSFPSDHAAGSFAFWSGIRPAGRKIAALFLVIAILVAFARIFVGAHWPTDVVAGAVIGTSSGAIVLWAKSLFRPFADGLIRLFRLAPAHRKRTA